MFGALLGTDAPQECVGWRCTNTVWYWKCTNTVLKDTYGKRTFVRLAKRTFEQKNSKDFGTPPRK